MLAKTRLLLLTTWIVVVTPSLMGQSQSALFEGPSEGLLGSTYMEDGLLFSGLDRYLGGMNEPFVVENASADLTGFPGFSSPNTLGFGGYAPGPSTGFSRCGTFAITPGGVRMSAELSLFVSGGSTSGNQVTLEASLSGSPVASETIVVPAGFGPHGFTFSLSGASFDSLRLIGTGPNQSGAFFAVIDSVHVDQNIASSYCIAGVNDTGSPAALSATGTASLLANDFVLTCGPLGANQPGIFFFSDSPVANPNGIPFGEGLRCVGGSIQRLQPPAFESGGHITRAVDWNNLPAGASVISGDTLYFQGWYRDTSDNDNDGLAEGFNLSDGLEITLTP